MRLVLALVLAAAVGCGARTQHAEKLSPGQARIFQAARARHARFAVLDAAGLVVVAIGLGRDIDRATASYIRAVRANERYLPTRTLVHDRTFGTASIARSLRPFCAPCAARVDALARSITSRA